MWLDNKTRDNWVGNRKVKIENKKICKERNQTDHERNR